MIVICGNGFIGSSLLKNFLKSGYEASDSGEKFRYLHRNGSENQNDVLHKPSIIINCSGPSSVGDSLKNPQFYISEPLAQIESHFQYFFKNSINPLYIYFSSASVYGNSTEPLDEESNFNPLSAYAEGKAIVENKFIELSNNYSGKIVSVRVASTFGPGLRTRVPYLIKNSLDDNKSLVLKGTGFEKRDFVHLNDVYQAVSLISKLNLLPISAFNLGSGMLTSMEELVGYAMLAKRNLAKTKLISFSGEVDFGNPNSIFVSIEKLRSYGFSPSFSASRNMIDFFEGFDD